MNKVLTFFYPIKSRNKGYVQSRRFKINSNGKNISIHHTVSYFENRLLPKIMVKMRKQKVVEKIELRKIINLHNHTGMRDFSQIKSMVSDIKSGKEILQNNKIPNIKLVKDIKGKWVLFDGHHSILAYLKCGREFLCDVPHLLITHEDFDFVFDAEILVFFGEHAATLENKDWRCYTINWQEIEENQLSFRIQKNIGELYDTVILKNLI